MLEVYREQVGILPQSLTPGVRSVLFARVMFLLFKLVSLNSTDWKELGWDFPASATITQTEQPEQPHPQVPSLVPLSTETILGQQGVTEKTQAPNPDSQSRLCSQRSRLPLGFLSFSGKWAPPRTWSSCSFPTCPSAGQVLIGRRGMTG